ncbi:MAG: GAF domain-containing protein, partial [Deltaproteobacteria bacterium]|nr:GAF domain-containing protein [Deltaproteobacteria bacterium]
MNRSEPTTPIKILITITLSIFFSELSVMFFISFLPPLSMWTEAFVDSFILLIALAPLLYFFLFRPLVAQQKGLREIGSALEQRVEERTRELKLANRALKALSSTSKALIHMTDEESLLEEICSVIVKAAGYRLTWVGFAKLDEAKTVIPSVHAGYEAGYLKGLMLTWADTERGQGPVGKALRSGKPYIARSILTEPGFEPWREEAIKRGYASCLTIPFTLNDDTKGIVVVYAEEPDAFDHDEVTLFTQLAGNLAFGIDALRLRDQRKKAED